MSVKLEYSAGSGQFRITNIRESNENADGYVTICDRMDNDSANHFIDQTLSKFLTCYGLGGELPTILSIRKEFYVFVVEQTKELNKVMNAKYQKRATIITKSTRS